MGADVQWVIHGRGCSAAVGADVHSARDCAMLSTRECAVVGENF